MDNIYRENILDHYKYPRNFGRLKKITGSASDGIVSCGDSLSIDLYVNKEVLSDIKFTGDGCAISMASASMLTEYAKEKSITNLQRLKSDDILKMLGINLTPTRLKCALLSLEVLQKAINNIKAHEIKG